MKIRYYLRGLGIGILFTTVFFLVSNNNSSQTMSDEQIKARAKELGMMESTVLAELPAQETVAEESTVEEAVIAETTASEVVEETVAEESTVEETVIEETTVDEVVEETVVEEPVAENTSPEESTEAETKVNESEQAASNTEPITIVVNRGEGSDTVSRRLADAGLVSNAHEYDRYLMANGYDKRIGAGEHVIPAGATWEEIAKILCNQM